MPTGGGENTDSIPSTPKKARKNQFLNGSLILLLLVGLVAGLGIAIYEATRGGKENSTAAAPPPCPDVLVQCPWFPDVAALEEGGGEVALPIFVLDVQDLPAGAYDPAKPLTLGLWTQQEQPAYPYRFFVNPFGGLEDSSSSAGVVLEPGGEELGDSSGSSSGSNSVSDSSGPPPPTALPPQDLYAALGILDSFYSYAGETGHWGQSLFADIDRDSDIVLRKSNFWPGLNLSDVPGEETGSVPDLYTRKVVQAQHEKDFLYAQLTLPVIGGPGTGGLNAQFTRMDGGEANLRLLRNQSEDPDLYSLPLGGPGLFMASYLFADDPSSPTPSCSFWIYVVDSGPEETAARACADGFRLQEWEIGSGPEESPPEERAWCNCFDTCGGWNGGASCESYSLEESADVYDLLNCGENNIKEVNLTLLDDGLIIDALQTVFRGVCLPNAYTAAMVQDLRARYEVTALFELERAADLALNESGPVVFATSEMEVSDYVFHAFDEGVVETPWGEVAQLLSNMTVAPGEAYSYDWEIRVVVRVTTEGEGVDVSTCRLLIPEPYCNPELDADSDGANDCIDECRDDPLKNKAGECGCGEADTDSDGDETADCADACADDPAKDSSSGICGCGVSEDDSDSDGVFDCLDACPADPAKASSPGVCGCGAADDDSDSDGVVDCPVTCSSATQPNITSISSDSGAAGLSITLTGSWPLAVPGANVRVLAWFNGSLSAETNDIVVASANPTTITFEAPGWSFPLLSDREVRFTVLVLPVGTPSSGYPTTCSSTAGQSPSQWSAGQFVTFTYDTFVVTLSSTTLSCNQDPINVTVTQPPLTPINPYPILAAENNFTVNNGAITGYPTSLSGYQVSFSFEITPSDSTSPITVTLAAGVLYGATTSVTNPEIILHLEGERAADSDSDSILDCNDGCPADPTKSYSGVCGCGTPDLDSDSDGTFDCNDECPSDPTKTVSGACGCGTPDLDSDSDGTFDCNDECPSDPTKTVPGSCGCGFPEGTCF